ncbi:MGMT family protein [Patescibacteria group bacterium]|nr:MGMT family protein [Patescibacteria group bacterium]
MPSKPFADRVREVVRNIPKGSTMTYAQVAAAAGRSKAYRAVGNILNRNFDPDIPCHRVIRSDGTPGGYNRGTTRKVEILRSEGALVVMRRFTTCPASRQRSPSTAIVRYESRRS